MFNRIVEDNVNQRTSVRLRCHFDCDERMPAYRDIVKPCVSQMIRKNLRQRRAEPLPKATDFIFARPACPAMLFIWLPY